MLTFKNFLIKSADAILNILLVFEKSAEYLI